MSGAGGRDETTLVILTLLPLMLVVLVKQVDVIPAVGPAVVVAVAVVVVGVFVVLI